MKKISILLCFVLSAVLLLAACGSQNAVSGSEDAAQEPTGKAASIIQPENVAYEARYYENDQLTCVEQYDDARRLLSTEGDLSDEYHYYEEYRVTDMSNSIDLTDFAQLDGVSAVECTQVFYHMLSEGDALVAQPTYLAFGYNENGYLCATRLYYLMEEVDHPIVLYQVVFDLNESGDAIHAVKTAGNGDVIFERDYQNNYDENGILMSANITGTFYGNQVFQDNTTVRETLETPQQFSSYVEYVG